VTLGECFPLGQKTVCNVIRYKLEAGPLPNMAFTGGVPM
jgi:hypothetical protein